MDLQETVLFDWRIEHDPDSPTGHVVTGHGLRFDPGEGRCTEIVVKVSLWAIAGEHAWTENGYYTLVPEQDTAEAEVWPLGDDRRYSSALAAAMLGETTR